ncbi:MAG: hypothetical protein ABI693_32990, partial [Bryobacteraceae bacterium]
PGEQPRPLREVNRILPGWRLLYKPQHASDAKARIALLIARPESDELQLMEPQPASQPASWTAPSRVSVAGLVYGPQGLDDKKVDALLKKDKQLIAQLADYAEQTAQTEALIEALTSGQPNPSRNVDAAISGFASRYGAGTRIDPTAPFDQNAMLMVRAINPALSSYDPLAAEPRMRMQQSAGLAASIAGLFFGNTVGLAAGGASLFLNLRTMMFPDTDFRSSFAQLAAPGDTASLALCAKREPAKARTRVAYLWAMRLPDAEAPAIALPSVSTLPAGLKSTLAIATDDWKLIERARDWQLERAGGATALPVPVRLLADRKQIELDLTKADVSPGSFHLSAGWDWNRMLIPGEIQIRPLPDSAAISPHSADKLIAGAGAISIVVTGSDLEFTEKLILKGEKTETPVEFQLPKGPRAGVQPTLTATIETGALAPGHYRLLAAQSNGKPLEVPLRVLPPNPVLKNLPLRVNLGELRQTLTLTGAGLDRIQAIESPLLDITLQPGTPQSRRVSIAVKPDAEKGAQAELLLKVEGLHEPLSIPAAVTIAGPRPRITSSQLSLPGDPGVTVLPGELPTGAFVNLVLRVDNTEAAPHLHLSCGASAIDLTAASPEAGVRLSQIHPGQLFLSLDPATAGPPGCNLVARAESDAAGLSDPYTLGRVVALPRIDSFQLTDEKLPDGDYIGTLTGYDLELVEKAGWLATDGHPAQGLPTPIAGEGQKQLLKIALPWPPPAPRSPIYLWLRGDTQGRVTKVRY